MIIKWRIFKWKQPPTATEEQEICIPWPWRLLFCCVHAAIGCCCFSTGASEMLAGCLSGLNFLLFCVCVTPKCFFEPEEPLARHLCWCSCKPGDWLAPYRSHGSGGVLVNLESRSQRNAYPADNFVTPGCDTIFFRSPARRATYILIETYRRRQHRTLLESFFSRSASECNGDRSASKSIYFRIC